MESITRRNLLKAGATLPLSFLLGGFSNEAVAGTRRHTATVWDISTGEQQKLLKKLVHRFDNKHSSESIKIEFFENDPYKTKIRLAMGAGNPPDIFFSWGGGVLKNYIGAGKVYPIGNSVHKNKFFPYVMNDITYNGKVYGIPNAGTQPVLFYYNKKIFSKYDISPPETWDDLLKTVKLLRKKGIVPISLAGKNKWPDLMYEEYLVNRIGGNSPFEKVLNNTANAWSDPAFIHANELIRELVSEHAFPKNFDALDYNIGQSTELLYTGKAAMQLMGAWDYQAILSDAPQFIRKGDLGWFNFPEVKGGKGDPKNVAGNPTNYYCISQESKYKNLSKQFLSESVMDGFDIDGLIKIGLVPPVKGIEGKLEQSDHPQWLKHIYEMAKNAPHFGLSWDQALSPQKAHHLLTNLDLLFLNNISPKQFSTYMNSVA